MLDLLGLAACIVWMVLLCGAMSLYIANHVPQLTDICERQCGCGKADPAKKNKPDMIRPSVKTNARR